MKDLVLDSHKFDGADKHIWFETTNLLWESFKRGAILVILIYILQLNEAFK